MDGLVGWWVGGWVGGWWVQAPELLERAWMGLVWREEGAWAG